MNKVILHFLLCCACILSAYPALAQEALGRWLGQTIYVPVYSHIYGEDRYRNKPFLLTATLSIRNTDPEKALTLKRVDYYDSSGQLLEKYLSTPVSIAPFQSTYYMVRESENRGGAGAKFIVEWEAEQAVIEPIVESVMIGTQMQQGISFLSPGRVIQGKPAKGKSTSSNSAP